METQPLAKKLMNNPDTIVRESLLGLALSNSSLLLLPNANTIIRSQIDQSTVSIICGGGSGHEPAHAGFVGSGLLTGAICGNVFASPSYQDIVNGIYHCRSSAGILLIIKNYTGDIVNFRLAKKICQQRFNLKIASLIVADDISLRDPQNSDHSQKSSRGVAGTVLLYKLLGAAAEKGMS
jgi:dihydroxyacetone kinase